ncbi:MAG: MoaD/ThiS family protein [Defluviitaleaceae bacterium]|nr:MoaD/ThiS family protein [Defluviitaleaceae bacterium]
MEVKLFASLREGHGKTAHIDWQNGICGHDIFKALNIQPQAVSIYLVNGKNANPEDSLFQGDIVSLFPPIGGG